MSNRTKNVKLNLSNLSEALDDDLIKVPEEKVLKLSAKLDEAFENGKTKTKERKAKKLAKAVIAPAIKPVEKLETATLQEIAKVVPVHKPVKLPDELFAPVTDPAFQALHKAGQLHQDSLLAQQEFEAKLEEKRELEKMQAPHAPRYRTMFTEAFQKFIETPGQEYLKGILESREAHAKQMRQYYAGLIDKALAKQNEDARAYIELEEQLAESRRWLAIHNQDRETKLFQAKEALKGVGVKYEDIFGKA
jgi:hypothetical protein